jgi:hypothetical protein
MTTFVQWLSDQRNRQDAVGWFACYWRDLEGKPRLSSPSSIATHLEDREAPGGFKDPAQPHLRDAFDATLKEFRDVRAQVVRPVPDPADEAGEAGKTPQGPAGEAVERATAAGLDAAAASRMQAAASIRADAGGITAPGIPANYITVSGGSSTEALLAAIYRKLDRIERAMGLAADEDGGALPADLPWPQWYAEADLSAVPE